MPAAAALRAAPFELRDEEGEPAELVVRPVLVRPRRLAVIARPIRRALVLGSAQDPGDADIEACDAAGVVVVRRHSGGGAVLVGPSEQVWLDVFVPAADPLYESDVSKAAWWLGGLWVSALADAGLPGGRVHPGPWRPGPFGRRACFAGLGPGEVIIGGRKVVGISQRRHREGAWLHTMALAGGGPAFPTLADLLSLEGDEAAELALHLHATTVHLGVPASLVEEALAARLARAGPASPSGRGDQGQTVGDLRPFS